MNAFISAAFARPSAIVFCLLIIFFVGIVITRSAGCVINDYFDQDFDKRVERTKDRVLANNQITNQEALVLFLI